MRQGQLLLLELSGVAGHTVDMGCVLGSEEERGTVCSCISGQAGARDGWLAGGWAQLLLWPRSG